MATIPGYEKGVRAKTPSPDQRSAAAGPLSEVAALVRRHDRDRFQTALFAPAARRDALFALYAFNYEIARVRESVSDPALGRIRLEWWRQAIGDAYENRPPRRQPVVAALASVIRSGGLTRAHFETLIDARAADLDEAAPADLAALEQYAEGTSSELVYLALEALGVRDAAAAKAGHHVGIAYALAGLLRSLPLRGSGMRPIIPAEIAIRAGLAEQNGRALRGQPGLRAAVSELAAAADRHLIKARQTAGVPRGALPALLPALIASRALQRLRRADYDPFATTVTAGDPLQAWRLLAAAVRGRF